MREDNHPRENGGNRSGIRIAITGTAGRLGGALKRIYAEGAEVTAFDRTSLDLADGRRLREVLESTDFDVLINPAALTSVDRCETEREAARLVNAVAPGVMAAICREKGKRFIHVSTDYVFGGEEPGRRREDDPTEPLGVYGQTKLEGERSVLEADPSALVVRVSWVFGPERPAFPEGIVSRAMAEGRVEAIADKWSTPTFADDFARYLEPLMRAGSASVSGILHLCNAGSCSWQEYGQVALDHASAFGLKLKTRTVEPLLIKEMSQFVVPRPVHTSMDTAKFCGLGIGTPRPWQDALGDYLKRQIQAGRFGVS